MVSAPTLTSDCRLQVQASRAVCLWGDYPPAYEAALTTASNGMTVRMQVHFLDGVLMAQLKLIYGTQSTGRILRITATYYTPSPQWRSNTCAPAQALWSRIQILGTANLEEVNLFWRLARPRPRGHAATSSIKRRSNASAHVATV